MVFSRAACIAFHLYSSVPDGACGAQVQVACEIGTWPEHVYCGGDECIAD
jgi:hypothetical protein